MKQLENMTTAEHEEYVGALRCATLRCAWYDVDSDWRSSIGTPFTNRCERCGRERRCVLNRYGEMLVKWRYWPSRPRLTYDKGQRPSAAEFRRMLMTQRLSEARAARKAAS